MPAEKITMIVFQLILLGGQIATYYIINARFVPRSIWNENLKALCNKNPEDVYHHENFKKIGYTFIFFGAYWGMYAQRQLFMGQTQIKPMATHRILRFLGRVIVLVAFVAPWIALF